MTNIPYSDLPDERPSLTPEEQIQVGKWVRLVAVEWARKDGDVPNVDLAWFFAGQLYEREQNRRNEPVTGEEKE